MATDARRTQVEDEVVSRVEADGSPITKAAIGDPTGDDVRIEGIGGGNSRGSGWGDGGVWSTFLHGLLDAIDMPVGVVLPYVGDPGDLPVGWQIADGTNGTPNLTSSMLKGGTVGVTGTVVAGAGVSYYEVRWIIRIAA
jgi:hypothetical protein